MSDYSILSRAFGSETSFSTREGILAAERRTIATLSVTSGKVCCCDPFMPGAAVAFSRKIPAGKYPVEILLLTPAGSNAWCSTARVRLSGKPAVKWVPATIEGENDGELLGYGVDSGVSCFIDEAGAASLESDTVQNALQRAFSGDDPGHGGVYFAEASVGDGNVVAFPSGGGDGVYGVWWGLDASGTPADLLTDFFFLGLVGDPLLPDVPTSAAAFEAWLEEENAEQREILDEVEEFWLEKLERLAPDERERAAAALKKAVHSKKLAARRDEIVFAIVTAGKR